MEISLSFSAEILICLLIGSCPSPWWWCYIVCVDITLLKAELFLATSTWDKVPWVYSPFIWLVFIYISSWDSSAFLWDLQSIKPSMKHQGTRFSILPSWWETNIWISAMQPLPEPGPTNTAHHIPTEPPSVTLCKTLLTLSGSIVTPSASTKTISFFLLLFFGHTTWYVES